LQENIKDAIEVLCKDLVNFEVKGLLNISRFPMNKELACGEKCQICLCTDCECCGEDILAIYWLECSIISQTDNIGIPQDAVKPVDHAENSIMWLTLDGMQDLENLNVSLIGPEPIYYLQQVKNRCLSTIHRHCFHDYGSDFFKSQSSKMQLDSGAQHPANESDGEIINVNASAITLLDQYHKVVNASIPVALQESLFNTANFCDEELLFLRLQFYGQSFPSCFINQKKFSVLSEVVLGEKNSDQQRDYFRLVISNV